MHDEPAAGAVAVRVRFPPARRRSAGTRRRHRMPARLPNLSVKSSRLPSSSTQSACASTWANAPSAGSLMPRGLSMPTTGTPQASARRRGNVRRAAQVIDRARQHEGARSLAQARDDRVAVGVGESRGSVLRPSGVCVCMLACSAPRRSLCRPPLPAPSSTLLPAHRTAGSGAPARAFPRGRCAWRAPCRSRRRRRSAQVQEALVTGAAMSAWCISWNAPWPSCASGAWPESSTTGDSLICAV